MRPYWHNLFRRLQGAENAGPPPNALITGGAAVASHIYGMGAGMRRALYGMALLRVRRLPAPVVSVGNLAVGGTGKTPVVACLARLLRDRGQRVAILSRGYGGRARSATRLSDGERVYHQPPEVGEEPYWLARAQPGVAVYTGASRYAAGLAAWEEFKPQIFLLDDGFQHVQLHRDLDLVLLDAAAPFGNGYVLPRGPLRESRTALHDAQVIVLTRFDPERHQGGLAALEREFPEKTVLTAAILPVRVTSYPGGQTSAPEAMRHRALVGFAGLGRPEVFTATLHDLGADLRGFQAFADHHVYSREDLRNLIAAARDLGTGALVTTGKDWARLGERWEGDVLLWVLEVEARLAGSERLLSFLDRILQAPLPS